MGFKKIISSIITTILFRDEGSERTPEDCAVCLSSLNGETEMKVLPCKHEFHCECVERWLAVPHFKNTCPLCRFSMEEEEDNDGGMRRQQQECFTLEMAIWFSSFHVAGF